MSRISLPTATITDADTAVDKTLDASAWMLNTADVPGTQAWDEMDLDARINAAKAGGRWISERGSATAILHRCGCDGRRLNTAHRQRERRQRCYNERRV